jgi:PhnO protein
MPPNYYIKAASADDLKFIYGVVCELENFSFDFDEFSLIYSKNISNPDNLYLILLEDNINIGYISLHAQSLLHHCGLIGEIQEFYINKNYRNKGLGKLLINEIEKEAKIRKLKGLEVTSNKKRIENVTIYMNLGYSLSHNKFTKSL